MVEADSPAGGLKVRKLLALLNQISGKNVIYVDAETGNVCKMCIENELEWYTLCLHEPSKRAFLSIMPEMVDHFRLRLDTDTIDLSQQGITKDEMDMLMEELRSNASSGKNNAISKERRRPSTNDASDFEQDDRAKRLQKFRRELPKIFSRGKNDEPMGCLRSLSFV